MPGRMIGVWKFSYPGLAEASRLLAQGCDMASAVEAAVACVEDNPDFTSVGYGGGPNELGEVELDASFMNGSDLSFGAVCSVRTIKNPIKAARLLSKRRLNCYLSASGAERFAIQEGLETRNNLTPQAYERWKKKAFPEESHDTVCVIGIDESRHLYEGVSTSGLFMKKPGRVGDSPVIGSGFYCDDTAGAAACTGVGEDAMRGCVSFRIVEKIREGMKVQEACEKVLQEHFLRMQGSGIEMDDLSVIAMDNQGHVAAATTRKKEFPFTVLDGRGVVHLFICSNRGGKMEFQKGNPE